jgi:hypothetical protein
MDQEVAAPITLRDALESNFTAAEEGTLSPVVKTSTEPERSFCFITSVDCNV